MKILLPFVFFLSLHVSYSQTISKQSAWLTATPEQRTSISQVNEALKQYLSKARTELTSTREVLSLAKSKGFKEFTDASQVKSGAKLYINNRDRAIALIVVGKNPIVEGSRLIATHHDSPRIDIKARPLYETSGYAMFQTMIYGGIKKYHWANIPLMLLGRIDLKNGKTVDVAIGDSPDEPVLIIPDAAPHADAPLRTRVYTGVFDGEELDPIIGSIPNGKKSVV